MPVDIDKMIVAARDSALSGDKVWLMGHHSSGAHTDSCPLIAVMNMYPTHGIAPATARIEIMC